MSSACFVIRAVHSYSNLSTLRMIYFAYFHANMEFDITFCGEFDR